MSQQDPVHLPYQPDRSFCPSIPQSAIQEFKAALHGVVLCRDDARFDAARKIFNGEVNKNPFLIAQCIDDADVCYATQFAQTHELPIAVRGGGHNVAGNALCDDGIVIDLSSMKKMHIDPQQQITQAQAGLTWGEFDRQTQIHGLATTGGTVSSTGIAGLTLGGGIGWLLGKYGLACDNLLSAEVVTATGELLTADPSTNADLFWGLRGGGGNFGIVTSFTFQLHPVNQVFGGTLLYPIEKASLVLSLYRSLTETSPDEFTANASLITINDVAFVAIDICYLGSRTMGEKLLRPLQNACPPLQNTLQLLPYSLLQSMTDYLFPFGRRSYWKSCYLQAFDGEAIDTILAYFRTAPSKETMVFIDHFHGVARRANENETAFGHRTIDYSLLIAANWTDSTASEKNKCWARDFYFHMQPFSAQKVYVNYLDREPQEEIKAAYSPENYARLVNLKNKYDPTNVFRLNQNIRPTV